MHHPSGMLFCLKQTKQHTAFSVVVQPLESYLVLCKEICRILNSDSALFLPALDQHLPAAIFLCP